MTKVTNIPSRLHSVEQGNIVAGANEVYDDTKGKKQNVINSETDAELLRLEQTKQDNLTFDNAPTENSNNPVKSGGVYAADLALQQAIEAILLLIPSAATSLNQLADKAFVNSSISTATATFRGTYNVVTDLHLAVDATHAQIETALALVIATADNNDYCYVQIPVSSSSQDIQKTSRYKFNGSAWVFEYDLNTSGFTSAQWAAINSGITAALVTKLGDLPTATELSTDLQALSTAIGNEETRAKGVEQGLSTAVQGILGLIPSEATSSNQLADKTYVTNLINAITALIPAEATDQNQLADKAYVLTQILAATPAFKGQFTTLADLEAVSSPKAGDIGIVRTTDSDGFAVFTFYQYLNDQWNVYYTLAHHLQNKPATTGTTGDYPYNGMGRVVLPMNIKEIGGVTANYLEQSMMPTATGGNTIYVITHDYILRENVIIPSNCVLKFDGGTIANFGTNNYLVRGSNTKILAGLVQIFDINVTIDGTWNVSEAYPEWFGAKTDLSVDSADAIQKSIDYFERVLLTGRYYSTKTINIRMNTYLFGKALYYSGIHFDDSVNVGIAATSHLQGVVLRDFNIDKDTKTEGSSGILMTSATTTSIENISITRFERGYDLNSYYVCIIKRCLAVACTYGFCFGKDGGNSTSTTIDSCYALWCTTGYFLRQITYSTLNSCACDQSTDAYTFVRCNVTLNDCGCESITGRALRLYATDDPTYGNSMGNYIHVVNFIIISQRSTVSPILIKGNTRWSADRNIFIISGLKVGDDNIATYNYLLEIGGDTQIFLNNMLSYGVSRANVKLFDVGNYKGTANRQVFVDGVRILDKSSLGNDGGHLVPRFDGDSVLTLNDGGYKPAYWQGSSWVYEDGTHITWADTYILTGLRKANYVNYHPFANQGFYFQLVALSGYSLPPSITITMGGVTLTEGTDYTYNSSNGVAYINLVTGDIVVTADGVS